MTTLWRHNISASHSREPLTWPPTTCCRFFSR